MFILLYLFRFWTRFASFGNGQTRQRFGDQVCSASILLLLATGTLSAETTIRGLPFTRSYSLEDIGYGPRGSNLTFDRYGRVAVIHDDVYAVLNDTTWLNIVDANTPGRKAMSNVLVAPNGRTFYGALASWGLVESRPDGLLYPVSLVPSDAPAWIRSTTFTELIATSQGVYFVSPNGLVFWSFKDQKTQFYNYPRTTYAFRIGDIVYVSAFEQPLRYVDVQHQSLQTVGGSTLTMSPVFRGTDLDEKREILFLNDGRLVVFDGQTIGPCPFAVPLGFPAEVSALSHLVDGNIAVGVTGRGVYLFSPSGELLLSLDTAQYHRVTVIANREPGVLWLATEGGIEKVLYGSALSGFGQGSGLTVGWPTVEAWRGRVFAASAGKFYRTVEGKPGSQSRFELCEHQPVGGAWSLAALGDRMLVGGADQVYSVESDFSLRAVARVEDLAHLVMTEHNYCYAIGRKDTALLEWREGKWIETGERTRGVPFPTVVHRVNNSAWIEMGNEIARLSLHDGRMVFEVTPNSPWTKHPWANIGSIGRMVVVSGGPGERRFFDETRGEWCDAPELRRLLDRSPLWIARVARDNTGTIWGTHNDGVIRFTPQGNDYSMDLNTFDLINDRYPLVHVLSGNEVWISASQSLYHVERQWAEERTEAAVPSLVSAVDVRSNIEILSEKRPPGSFYELPFTNSLLTFRFYSGSDAWRRAPSYEYRLTDSEGWTPLAGSQLSLRGLHEGKYKLSVRLANKFSKTTPAEIFAFEVLPPWYRTKAAYRSFVAFILLLFVGFARWSSRLERKRNKVLAELVQNRTQELQATMAKLNEETRISATLAERDRLANEIHDSVQQGLTGAILQLDSTLKQPTIVADLRKRLNVARNMVSYARQEVQHAVWEMESPLLDGTGLAEALHNLTTFVNSGDMTVEVMVVGEPVPLERRTGHNLLRIAQEATTNAFRHSAAQRITILLEFSASAVSLEIRDDGRGFDPDQVIKGTIGHLGLRGIRTRVKKLSGHLDIRSSLNQGASIQVRVPVKTSVSIESHVRSSN